MVFPRLLIASSMWFTVLLAGAAVASEPTPRDLAEWGLVQRLAKGGDSVDSARANALRLFMRTDVDGGGISESDYGLTERLNAARQRMAFVAQTLNRDLDGDGEVTRAELASSFMADARKPIKSSGLEFLPTTEQIEQRLEKLVSTALKPDRNRDGRITYEEALVSAQIQLERNSRHHRTTKIIPLSLDLDGDGTVSKTEFTTSVNLWIRWVDSNGDGLFSLEEIRALREQAKEARSTIAAEHKAIQAEQRRRDLSGSCGLPQVPRAAEVLVIGTNHGAALSTVSLDGDGATVTLINVRIEPGSTQLYLLLASSAAAIWQVTGAVDRVTMAVASSQRAGREGVPRAGVIGLPADRVHIPPMTECLRAFTKTETNPAAKMRALLPYLIDRDADLLVGDVGLNTISLPSGQIDATAADRNVVDWSEDGAGAELWRAMHRRYPGGLVTLDADKVVSRAVARRYLTLPQHAGLAQLVDDGALQILETEKRISRHQGEVLPGDKNVVLSPGGLPVRYTVLPRKLLITRKIRFPADLSSGMEFILGAGVPIPDGSPGRSKFKP